MIQTLALVLLAGTSSAAVTSTAAPHYAYHDASPAECEVYAAYLEKNFKPSKKDGPLARAALLVENESIDAWQSNRRAWEGFLLKRITGPGRASDACLKAFLLRPEQTLRFFKFPPTRHALRLVRSDALSQAFAKGWDGFYDAYPGSNGFLSFGVLAFGPGGDEALFTVRSLCGKKCGYRDVVYMQKLNGNWEIVIKESLP